MFWNVNVNATIILSINFYCFINHKRETETMNEKEVEKTTSRNNNKKEKKTKRPRPKFSFDSFQNCFDRTSELESKFSHIRFHSLGTKSNSPSINSSHTIDKYFCVFFKRNYSRYHETHINIKETTVTNEFFNVVIFFYSPFWTCRNLILIVENALQKPKRQIISLMTFRRSHEGDR